MTILAIETTGTVCGAAVADIVDGAMVLRGMCEVAEENVHDERLATLVATVLSETGVAIDHVDVVAVSGGPGSFTGTRIGVSFAKGLTMTGTPRLLVVDTSLAMAQASAEVAALAGTSRIITVIPSHRSLYYVDYSTIVNGVAVRSDDALAPQLIGLSGVDASDAVVCGPGARDLDPNAVSGLTRLSARFVALRATQTLRDQSVDYADPLTAEPLYRQAFVGRQT